MNNINLVLNKEVILLKKIEMNACSSYVATPIQEL